MPANISAKKRAELDRQTKRRIDALQKKSVPTRSSRENLDAPLDAGFRVDVDKPHMKSLALYRDGQMVSKTALWVHDQFVRGAPLRMGGIGGVATPPEHRFKGYSRVVMENALQWMRQNGYDVAMLFGILSFYPKFGYAVAFPKVQGSLPLEYLCGVPKGAFRFVQYTKAHLKDCLRAYRRRTAGMTGPVRRKPSSWRPWREGMGWGADPLVRVALTDSGRFAGYLVFDKRPDALAVIEAAWADPRVTPAALHEVGAFSRKHSLDHLRLRLPEDDPLVEFCKPLGLRLEKVYHRDGEGMIRMVNTRSALHKLAPRLGENLPGRGALNLRTNLDEVGLVWKDRSLSVRPCKKGAPSVRLPQWALAQMLYGFTTASAHAAAGYCRGAAKNIRLLDRLFPPGPHFYYPVDGF